MVKDLLISIAMLLASAIVYCFLLAKLKNRVSTFRDWILLPAAAGSGFIVYFIGFATCPDPDMTSTTIFRAIHATVMMILMESTIGDISEQMRSNHLYMVFFSIAHFLGILLTTTTALSLFGRRVNAKLRIMTSFHRNCYIFFNINEESLTLAKDLLANDRSRDIFFVGEAAGKKGESSDEESSDIFDRIESIGAYYIDNSDESSNGIGGRLLFKHIINTNSKLIYICPDENHNISAVLHLFSLLKEISPAERESAERNTSVYLQIDSEDMIDIFEEARRDMGVTIDYSIFSVPEIIAQQLVRTYNPSKYVAIDGAKGVATQDFEVMVIGFGRNGRNMLRRIIEFGQFEGSRFHATVVDREVDQKIGSFDANYPGVMKNYLIEPIADCVGSKSFFSLVKERSSRLKQIVISLDSDSLNVKIAIEVNKIFSAMGLNDIDIIIVTRERDNYLYLHNSDDFDSIHCIGQNVDTFTEDIIINESLWNKAKATHDHYNSTKALERRKPWSSLESIKRQSNISASLHIGTKLSLLGLTKEQLCSMSREEYMEYITGDKERYENLARTEHLRWNATYFSRGWQPLPLSTLKDNSISQDHHRKLHVCLVSWEELVAVEKFFDGEPYQRYDFDNIDAMYELVKLGLVDDGGIKKG